MKRAVLTFLAIFSKIIKYALIIFIALFFLLLISLANTYKNFKSALSEALNGRNYITLAVEAVKNKNWSEGVKQSELAKENFQKAIINLEETRSNKTISSLKIFQTQVNDLEYLCKTGEILSRSLSNGLNLVSEIDRIRSSDSNKNFADLSLVEKNNFLKLIYESGPELNGLKANLKLAEFNIEKINKIGILFPVYQQISNIKVELAQATKILDQVIPLTKVLPVLGGYPEKNNFLIILQNNDELRPSGGFIGVYGILISQSGEIISLKTADSYHLDMPAVGKWNYPAPEQITKYLKVSNWYFRDSNWSPDWPQASEKMIEIFNGEKVSIGLEKENFSGVIGITPDFIASLLRITGPISVKGETYNENNLQTLLQYTVEVSYKEADISSWDRKNVINDLIEELKVRLFNLPSNRWNDLLSSFDESIKAKNIQLYFTDPAQQFLSKDLKASGEVIRDNGTDDYLMVVDANLASFKSDAVMEKNISYKVNFDKNKDISSNLVLNYKHNGDFNWRTTRYRTYTRIYLPQGTEFISLNGIDNKEADLSVTNDDKLNKTIIGFFWVIEPGDAKEINLNYRLPNKNREIMAESSNYNLIWQKQAGSRAKTELTINYLNNIKKVKPLNDQKISVELK
jgi:hypothetical protein